MRWEALLWTIFAIAAPAAVRMIWRRTSPSIPGWAQPLINGAGWLHGLLLPYTALLFGSISGRKAGLYGISPLEWGLGTVGCVSGLLAVMLAHKLRPHPQHKSRAALDRWKDEPRWALYRTTGVLWLQDIGLGAGLGFLFSIVEWALVGLVQDNQKPFDQEREMLYRSGVSTILYLLTKNFWLTAGTQLIFFILLELWSHRQALD